MKQVVSVLRLRKFYCQSGGGEGVEGEMRERRGVKRRRRRVWRMRRRGRRRRRIRRRDEGKEGG